MAKPTETCLPTVYWGETLTQSHRPKPDWQHTRCLKEKPIKPQGVLTGKGPGSPPGAHGGMQVEAGRGTAAPGEEQRGQDAPVAGERKGVSGWAQGKGCTPRPAQPAWPLCLFCQAAPEGPEPLVGSSSCWAKPQFSCSLFSSLPLCPLVKHDGSAAEGP